MALRLPPHSHCIHCDLPITEGGEFCSELCIEAFEEAEAAERRKNRLGYVGLGVIALVFILIRIIL